MREGGEAHRALVLLAPRGRWVGVGRGSGVEAMAAGGKGGKG